MTAEDDAFLTRLRMIGAEDLPETERVRLRRAYEVQRRLSAEWDRRVESTAEPFFFERPGGAP